MDLTPELAATTAQVIPVFALGLLVTFGTRRRSYSEAELEFLKRSAEVQARIIARLRRAVADAETPVNRYAFNTLLRTFLENPPVEPSFAKRTHWVRVLEVLLVVVGVANAVLFTVCLYVVGNESSLQSLGVPTIGISLSGLLSAAGYAALRSPHDWANPEMSVILAELEELLPGGEGSA